MVTKMNLVKVLVIGFAAVLLQTGCASLSTTDVAATHQLTDRQAIEEVLRRANLGFEVSNADLFANAFAEDATFELNNPAPVTGYKKLKYSSRADIRTIVADRVERARTADPKTLSYDPASLRRFNRNTDSYIELIDANTARHYSTWMVVMHTNVNIHISAIGRYEDELVKRNGQWFIKRRMRIE